MHSKYGLQIIAPIFIYYISICIYLFCIKNVLLIIQDTKQLEKLYATVGDVDLIVGDLFESLFPDVMVDPAAMYMRIMGDDIYCFVMAINSF